MKIKLFGRNLLSITPTESYNTSKNKTASDNFIEIYSQVFGELSKNTDKFTDLNAFLLALNLSEIYNPIDFVANKVASLKYDLVNEKGDIVEPIGNLKNLLINPNALDSFSDITYKMVFSGLADGNIWVYSRNPFNDGNQKITVDNIKSVWCLTPNLIRISEKSTTTNILSISSKSDIYDYLNFDYNQEKIYPNAITHQSTFIQKRTNSLFIAKSPLNACERNINNLLAVYSARLNVYKNNGMAGLLVRKSAGKTGEDALVEMLNPAKREEMLKQINSKNGLTGNKNIWGVSDIDMNFIKTLATISELQPFEETEADALVIAGNIGVDKDLLNTKDNSNYENKKNAEINFWQNLGKQQALDVAELWTKALHLEKLKLVPNFADVEVLKSNEKTVAETNSIKIDNLIKLKQIQPNNVEIDKKLNELI